jgi:catechol 2,3-dioxygenase-like lactoylglutathione lyase family enzyme
MTVKQMHHVGIVVADMPAAIAFFVELGLELEGEAVVEGEWAGRIIGLGDVRSDIAMLRTPDGRAAIELSKFHEPPARAEGSAPAPSNTLGLRHLAFEVTDLDDVLARLGTQGATLVGEVVQYEDVYRLCYVRGPEGILVEVAQPLR